MRRIRFWWLFGPNPDINTLGNDLPAEERRLSPMYASPGRHRSIEEETHMGFMRKQMLLQQRASFEQTLQERMSSLSKKGIQPPKTDKDPIVKKLKADIKAVNKRLRAVAENDKKTEENTKRKADRAAAPKEQEAAKSEKPKKASDEGKVKKAKPEGGKIPKPAGEGKAEKKKGPAVSAEAPAGPVKTPETA